FLMNRLPDVIPRERAQISFGIRRKVGIDQFVAPEEISHFKRILSQAHLRGIQKLYDSLPILLAQPLGRFSKQTLPFGLLKILFSPVTFRFSFPPLFHRKIFLSVRLDSGARLQSS